MSVKVHEGFCLDSAQDRFWWIDHFLGDQVQDEWNTGGAGGSTAVVDQQVGGIIRLTTGALTNNWRLLNWGTIRTLLVTKKVSMEIRSKISSTTNIRVWLNLIFDWSNYIAFFYDTSLAHVNWQIYSEDGGINTTADSGVTVDTDYHIFRIECFPAGEVHFYIDGVETANSPITTNIPDDATDYLEPDFEILTWADADKQLDIDYVAIRQDR